MVMLTVPKIGIRCQKLPNFYHLRLPFVKHVFAFCLPFVKLKLAPNRTKVDIQKFEETLTPKEVF